jgi:hypothetical protein
MSDFFTHLAELSLGNANVVQPLIAPRFTRGLEVAPDSAQDSLWPRPSSAQTSAPQLPPAPESKQEDSPPTAEARGSETLLPAATTTTRHTDRAAQPPIQTFDAQSVDVGGAHFPTNVEAEQSVSLHQAREYRQSTRREVEEQQSSSRPTIRVNIGRIDVRATTPRTSPETNRQPAPPAPPKLSLEDYLKRRKGEGR